MKRSIIYTLFLIQFCFLSGFCTHIVGGDFSYRHLSGDTYELKLKMYRDCSPGTADFNFEPLRVGIFDRGKDTLMDVVEMYGINTYILNFDSVCINAVLKCVEARIYTAIFTMPAAQYNNMDGYYVSWERCCRNNIITNIANPGNTAMAFYMELPSPYPGGGPFRLNSSPEYTVDPLNFSCVGDQFTYNFKGQDDDGDNLKFSLITPLNGGHSTPTDPNGDNTIVEPGPYNDVTWASGYDLTNIMDGAPDITVDPVTGLLSVVPTQIGVYVLSVLCEEFRGGVKIGEIRREVQFEVLDCPEPRPPEITTNTINNHVHFELGTKQCFQVIAKDTNEFDPLEVYANAFGYNVFNNGATLSPVTGMNLVNGQFCWTPPCNLDTSLKISVDFIVADQTCPFRLRDTVTVDFTFSTQPNNAPVLSSSLAGNTINIKVGEQGCFFVTATDVNTLNNLVLTPVFNPVMDVFNLGATLSPDPATGKGTVTTEFCWTPPCDLNFSGPIDVAFAVEDNASCSPEAFDTLHVTVNVLPFANNAPILQSNAPGNHAVFTLGRDNCFTVSGQDIDVADLLEMSSDFSSGAYADGAVLNPDFVSGNFIVNTKFCWKPSCKYIAGDSANVRFLIRDNKCANEQFDTLDVLITFKNAQNTLPYFVSPDNHLFYIEAGKSLDVNLLARDNDLVDTVYLDMENFESAEDGIRPSFEKAAGEGEVSSVLHIETPCDYMDNQIETLRFYAYNESCYSSDTSYLEAKFVVLPLRMYQPHLIPNAFSPNGDGVNDVFKLESTQESDCTDMFSITIFDRWGQMKFRSADPEFIWDGKNANQGAYVYIIRLGKKSITGVVSVVQ